MNKKIIVKWDEEFCCFDIEILDPEATAGEFEEECRDLFSEDHIIRKYSDSCIGCSICCSERIPITTIDLIRIAAGDRNPQSVDEMDIKKLADDIVTVTRFGSCIDVTMKVDEWGICRFWVKDKGICSIYRYRPFACRTYICAPVSRRFEELRTQIINQGQDGLVSLMFCDKEIDDLYKFKNTFADARKYHDIKLRDICNKRLWRMLYAK